MDAPTAHQGSSSAEDSNRRVYVQGTINVARDASVGCHASRVVHHREIARWRFRLSRIVKRIESATFPLTFFADARE